MALDIRRISMFAMCLVVLTTTVGFACLVFAASAMGMPSDHGMSGCGAPSKSTVACPHEHPAAATTPSATDTAPQSISVLASPAIPIVPVDPTLCVGDGEWQAPEPPESHLTPLRV